jgi:myo-inositol 2-dehydrogenase/D-chiro-inositol 1-dehydrogenase
MVAVMSIRVGVIGAGGMGREHIANLSYLDEVEIVVVADIVGNAAADAAALCGAVSSTDPVAVVADVALDAIVIASPDDTHVSLAIAAVERGAYVLCEKPLASTLADAERVVAAERAAGGGLIQVGFMRQYDAAHIQLQTAMVGLGAVRHLRCVHRNTNQQWERSLEVVVSQSLIHDIHTAHWLAGSKFTSVVTQVVSGSRPIEHIVVLGQMADGSTVTIEFVEATYGYDVEVEATCEFGVASAAQPAQPVVKTEGAQRRHIGDDWFGRFTEAYRSEVADWIAGVRSGSVAGPTSADGLEAQRVADAAIRSAVSGEREQV